MHTPLVLLIVAFGVAVAACAAQPVLTASAPLADAPGCPILPEDSIWNTPVNDLEVHPRSDDWVDAIGSDSPTHPDFGSGTFEGQPIGIPYDVVSGDQPGVNVTFTFADESDPPPYPIPADASIEGGPDADGDRHVLVVDADECVLYELFAAFPQPDGSWQAGSGAIFDLRSNMLRPDTWTSADAAGLPILPGLVRFDEVDSGLIDHALRITAPRTDRSYVWPARHQAGAADDPGLPPMGARVRLRADVDPAGFGPQVAPIVQALKTYGAFLADNGSAWFLSGVPDERWDNEQLRELRSLDGAMWEVVDPGPLQLTDDSGAALQQGSPPATGRRSSRLSGDTRITTAIAIAQRQWPAAAPVVYLARADNTVDAVAGGTLTDGPVLLVPSCGTLPAEVADEIRRLDPDEVIALGGTGAICDELLEEARTA